MDQQQYQQPHKQRQQPDNNTIDAGTEARSIPTKSSGQNIKAKPKQIPSTDITLNNNNTTITNNPGLDVDMNSKDNDNDNNHMLTSTSAVSDAQKKLRDKLKIALQDVRNLYDDGLVDDNEFKDLKAHELSKYKQQLAQIAAKAAQQQNQQHQNNNNKNSASDQHSSIPPPLPPPLPPPPSTPQQQQTYRMSQMSHPDTNVITNDPPPVLQNHRQSMAPASCANSQIPMSSRMVSYPNNTHTLPSSTPMDVGRGLSTNTITQSNHEHEQMRLNQGNNANKVNPPFMNPHPRTTTNTALKYYPSSSESASPSPTYQTSAQPQPQPQQRYQPNQHVVKQNDKTNQQPNNHLSSSASLANSPEKQQIRPLSSSASPSGTETPLSTPNNPRQQRYTNVMNPSSTTRQPVTPNSAPSAYHSPNQRSPFSRDRDTCLDVDAYLRLMTPPIFRRRINHHKRRILVSRADIEEIRAMREGDIPPP